MVKTIEARAVISAEDKTGATFDKIAKKMDGLAKAGKSSKAIEDLSKSLERARVQMAAIDRFTSNRTAFDTAQKQLRAAQAAAEAHKVAMASIASPDRRAAEAEQRRLARAVDQTRKAYEMQRDAVFASRSVLQQSGVPIKEAVAHQTKLRAAIDKTSTAIERQAKIDDRRQVRRIAIGGALAAGGAMAAHGVKAGTKATLHTYREFDRERRFGKAVMGLSDEEQAPLVQQAIHMGATTKFNDIQVLEAQRELAARGLKSDQIMGMMKSAADLGSALDLSLPEAVKQMEGAIFGFKKDIDSLPAALASAKQTADYQVRAAKASGMTPEDLRQLYKFGATPARMGGLSEASLLGFGGVLKKANIGGDEAGVAFRALMATIQAPTAGAKTALLANGMNYKNYQGMRDRLDVAPFADDVAARYGVKLDKRTRDGLGSIFSNKELISDPAKFNPAVTSVLRETLGGRDAKSLKSISGAANRYRDNSVNGVDANAMIKDLLPKLANNLPLANKLFGSKQGGRIATALGDSETLTKIINAIERDSAGYAEKIAAERMAGFDGAVSRFEGAVKNLETSVGRAFDKDGKGGLLTGAVDIGAQFTQWLAERDSKLVAGGSVAAGAGGLAAGAYGAYKFLQILTTGAGLPASAVALNSAAAALTAAAGALGGGGVAAKAAGVAGGAASTAAAGGIWGAGVAAVPGIIGGVAAVGGLAAMRYTTQAAGYNNLTSGQRGRMARGGSIAATRRKYWNMDRQRLGLPEIGTPPELDGPEISPTMTYQNSMAGKPNWGNPLATSLGASQSVSGQVTGQVTGETKLTVVIEASSELIKAVSKADAAVRMVGALQGALNPNGPGSTGRSSPGSRAVPIGSTGSW